MVDEVAMTVILTRIRGTMTNTPLEEDESEAIYQQLHDLAEQQFAPARTFCESRLCSVDAAWRLIAVQCLFHYDLSDSPALLTKVRWLLANDPDSDVRIWLSGILGAQHTEADAWPDAALVRVLAEDPVIQVRFNAFRELLLSSRIPYARALQVFQQFERGEIQPTWAELERIVTTKQDATQP